ncbi:hypothetical protein [Nonomuraea endophytica]|uniref:hypothetical protein n=1 Tax=Nonomuraea endophytica TaxID=714136 RepID=UPI0037C9DF10
MDKRAYIPGTPAEVGAQLERVARQQGRARRLLNRRGRLDPARADDIKAAAAELVASGAVVTGVLKTGFPTATPREQALEDATTAAREHGRPITAEIVETPEHTAAGEYLVKVLVIDGTAGRAQLNL